MTTDRHDPDPRAELDDEFWGAQSEWVPQRAPRPRLGNTFQRWWGGLLGGDAVAERSHGINDAVATNETAANDASDGRHAASDDLAERGRDDVEQQREDDLDDAGSAWTLERDPSRGSGIDPLLARFGGLAIIVTLAAPLIVGFTSSGSGSQDSQSALVTIGSVAAPDSITPMPSTAQVPITDVTAAAAGEGARAGSGEVQATPSAPVAVAEPSATQPSTSGPASTATALLEAEAEPVATAPVVTTPPCGSDYELAAGDYWIRIADEAGVTLADLLEVNEATVATVLVPGRSICLPVGATTPSPPTTVATTTPAASPPATSPPAASPPATSRPTPTTVAPTTTTAVPARPAAVPASQAEAIIRQVWPDDIEDRALEIAWRESNYKSNVNNWCCYGLFQIHWQAHQRWLATIGVTSVAQLLDPAVNATAAYTLYQRSGGFGPWGG